MALADNLKEYRSMKAEIAELRVKLDNLDPVVSDVIMDYRTGYPIPQQITGVDYSSLSRTRSRYITRIMSLEAAIDEAEEYIDSLEESLTRRIVRMYFCEGITQQKIAKKVHIDQSVVSRRISKVITDLS